MTSTQTKYVATGVTTRLLRLPEVLNRVGYRRSTIYAKIQRGEFPAPVALGPRAVAWVSGDIDAWIGSRLCEGRK